MNLIRLAVPSDAEAIARIHVQAWQESYRDIIAQEYLSEISYDERLNLRKRIFEKKLKKSLNLVAMYDNKMVGFCDAGPSFTKSDDYLGEIYAIYLIEQYKHLGIGAKFVEQAHEHLVKNGLSPYIAWVLEANTIARRFYEKSNGVYFKEKMVKIGNREYKEVSYIFGKLKE